MGKFQSVWNQEEASHFVEEIQVGPDTELLSGNMNNNCIVESLNSSAQRNFYLFSNLSSGLVVKASLGGSEEDGTAELPFGVFCRIASQMLRLILEWFPFSFHFTIKVE